MSSSEEKHSVSTTLFIRPSQDERLAALAKKDKRSKAYIIREAIDAYIANLEVK